MTEAEKIIMSAKIAMGQSSIKNSSVHESRFRTRLMEMFTDTWDAVDYDDLCELFGEEPKLSQIAFHLSTIGMDPEHSRIIGKRLAELATSVLLFNMIEADQPQDVIDAIT